ncbi:PrsW family intramembrane metalloprotease [Actinophytocola algeriensis]|uniref:RsiW-degrading membrane proteinase PrsW (M82 family) n=1 Tax=Actinophytocola algeriensis TaxID=1768010 RepID=A0A7W7QE79_9PSEU|nr:PrsW family glutamic-type intramembrane protease [Actinophytocola algeriensis]MBB4911659.1 RsiW-degrading membrane proteinase PrsW (M82 family) [Actinophytocola algeriensis]MBE1473353.1 RsiW-degrading membrane proteinase PrsW (M82 family) [Actinophytocola algeriensis]
MNRKPGTVLLLAAGLSALYLLWLVLYQTRPEVEPMPEPGQLFGTTGVVLMFTAPFSWLVAGAVLLVRRGGQGQLVAAAVLVAPFAAVAVSRLVVELPLVLVCLPSTVFALWGVRAWQRHRHMPAGLSLAALGWGGLVAISVAGGMNVLFLVYSRLWQAQARSDTMSEGIRSGSFDLEDLVDEQLAIHQTVQTLNMVHAGVIEELAKGAGIAILYLLARRWFDSVLSGMVVGASVGLGFNLAESVEYMARGAPEFQYWARQSVMLFGAHTAFSALVGAGFGIARQVADPRRRRGVILLGFLMAMSGHFVYNAVGPSFTRWLQQLGFGDTVLAVAGPPVTMLVLQGPYLLIGFLLLRGGVRAQTAGLSREFFVEAGSPHGAVTDAEVPVLLDPLRRWLLRVLAARRHGFAAYRHLGRLHAAQLDLGMRLWHQRRGEAGAHEPGETELRDRVLAIRAAAPLSPDRGEKVGT